MSKFKAALAAFIVPMMLVLSACGIDAGTVTDKEYHEPYTTQKKVYTTNCYPAVRSVTYYDANGNPKQRLENYQDCRREWTGEYKDVYHEAEWELHLENDEGKTGSVNVSEEDYNYYDVGDWYEGEQ